MPLQIDVAELGGLVGEGVIYGIGTSLSLVLAGVMFLLATGQIIVDTLNVFLAFFHHETRAERIAFLTDSTQDIFAWKFSIVTAMLFFGDCLVHYRCYVIWENLWIVVLPFLLSVAGLVSGFVIIGATRNHLLLTFESQTALITCVFALTLAANAISTILLTFKLWKHDRATRRALRVSQSSVTPIIRLVAESGAMSATYHIIFAVALETKSNALQTLSEMATSTFALIAIVLITRAQLNADRSRRNTSHPILSAHDFRASRSIPAPQVTITKGTVHVVADRPEDWKSEAIEMV